MQILDERIRLVLIHSAFSTPKSSNPLDTGRAITKLASDPNAVELAAAWASDDKNAHDVLASALADHSESFLQDNLGFDIVNAFENAFNEAMNRPGNYALATRQIGGLTIAVSRMIEATGQYSAANDPEFDHVA